MIIREGEDGVPTQGAERFLEDYEGRSLPWARPTGAPTAFESDRILFGNGNNALEVAVASTTRPGQPMAEDLRALFKKPRPTGLPLSVSPSGIPAWILSRSQRSWAP